MKDKFGAFDREQEEQRRREALAAYDAALASEVEEDYGLGAAEEPTASVGTSLEDSAHAGGGGGLDIDVEQAIDDYIDSGRGNKAMRRNYAIRATPKGQ